jgi:glycosyltransferase involved in cell wall biosynthesis
MKKELKINMSKLSIGGMEKALVDLLNNSDLVKNYNVTLLLVYNSKINYLDLLPKNIKLDLVYKGNWNITGKIMTVFGLILRLFKALFKKYDASICYSHHHQVLALLSRLESKNNIVFIHTDLENSRTPKELAKLCHKMQFDKFKKVVCVSERAKTSFTNIYPNYQGKVVVANNYIDGGRILKSSKEKIKESKAKELITFLSVARHEETHKKISRIIKATKELNKEGYKFQVLLVGDGKDSNYYQQLINDLKLNNIKMLGSKSNPFPYYKTADAFVFSSSSEGYGVVLNEARVLHLPIITTDVADAKNITNEGYGILCENSDQGIYKGMKEFLKNGYKITKAFDYEKFNQKITTTINDIVKE